MNVKYPHLSLAFALSFIFFAGLNLGLNNYGWMALDLAVAVINGTAFILNQLN